MRKIFFVTFLLFSIFCFSFYKYHSIKKEEMTSAEFHIKAIIQTHQGIKLPTAYLAELLHLSLDSPQNLYAFSNDIGLQHLKSCPVIESASLKKVKPQTLDIKYTARRPIAYLGDYENTLIDSHLVPFPQKPFYTPKNLLTIFCKSPYEERWDAWGLPINSRELTLSLNILNVLENDYLPENHTVKIIDTRKAFAPSLGDAEIILTISKDALADKKEDTYLIRLSFNDWENQIKKIPSVFKAFSEDNPIFIIDMRILPLSFISYHS